MNDSNMLEFIDTYCPASTRPPPPKPISFSDEFLPLQDPFSEEELEIALK